MLVHQTKGCLGVINVQANLRKSHISWSDLLYFAFPFVFLWILIIEPNVWSEQPIRPGSELPKIYSIHI